MKPVMEIVNYIHTHALNHRQFNNLIAELDQGLPGDLPQHCTVRWLSKGQVLSRFFQLLDAVKLFMEEKDKGYPELSDLEWIMDLAFLVNMLCHLERLNPTLQEAVLDLKEELKPALNRIKERLKRFTVVEQKCKKAAEHIRSQARHTDSQIKAEFEKLHKFLQEEEEARLAAL
ncbi:hypothetical protein COCON_G00034740 [Conger conger]|uniref:Uncharacterized protein n=1 Tax=Conger conger TaxID=82655 RepID=A0A9Q1I6P2_CONCO|nr:hypothetical protein COCON_G00034740 [Conger conger]